jgi:hypothetical protein
MPPRFSSIALWAGIGLIGASIYFFLAAISLISPPATEVVAALLSAVIGFVMLSAGTSLIRTYVVSRVLEGDAAKKT